MVSLHTSVCDFGWKAVDFDLAGVDGKRHSLSSARGPNGLLVMFICNHCPYVKAVIDRIVRDCRDLAGHGVGSIAIMSNDPTDYPEDAFDNMKRVAAERAFPMPYLFDESQETAKAYGAVCTPHVFAFNKGRVLRYRGRIDDSREPSGVKSADLRNALDDLVRGDGVRVPDTRPFGCSIKWFSSKPG